MIFCQHFHCASVRLDVYAVQYCGGMWLMGNKILPCTITIKWSSMEYSWILRQQVSRWKYSFDHSCTFKGPPKIHFIRYLFFKACEARMDPIEDMSEKGISPTGSCWAAVHDDKSMVSGITIWCIGDGSYIDAQKFGWSKSRLQPKFQGWARVNKVLQIIAKF